MALELEASNIREAIKPGQFFHVKCDDGYLRRPFSVYDFKDGILKIAFEARGKVQRHFQRLSVETI